MGPLSWSRNRLGRSAAGHSASGMSRSISRGRSRNLTPPNSGRKRRRVSSSVASTRRRSSTVSIRSSQSGSHPVHGKTDRTVNVSRSKRKIKLKGRKTVKVSPLLRKKIQQVSDGAHIHGYYQDNRVDIEEPGLIAGKQAVERLPNRGQNYGGYLFNYDRILHAASRLWNAKAANPAPVYSDANNFNPADSVINVKRQWWTFRMRNNCSRTCQIRVYKCQSKNAVQNEDALSQWADGLAQMTSTGELVSVTTVNNMHIGPSLSNQFRSGYKTELIEITMEPGQAYSFNIQGPRMVYDGKKFYNNATYVPIQKQDIQLLWVSNVDLVGTVTAGTPANFGYAPDTSSAYSGEERVIVESTYHCSLSMPEKVGGISTAVASIFQNQNRVKRVCIDDFESTSGFTGSAAGTGSGIIRRDEENPAQNQS